MAIHITTTIQINGADYSSALVNTVKGANLLDEQLDEAKVVLQFIRREKPFPPLTPVRITFQGAMTFTPWTSAQARTMPTQTLYYLVADDDVEEQAAGNGFFRHTLSLIELTKDLEMFIGDSLTFTNDLGRIYAE